MKTKLLCDQCKREFEADEDLMEDLLEILCPDCEGDKLI